MGMAHLLTTSCKPAANKLLLTRRGATGTRVPARGGVERHNAEQKGVAGGAADGPGAAAAEAGSVAQRVGYEGGHQRRSAGGVAGSGQALEGRGAVRRHAEQLVALVVGQLSARSRGASRLADLRRMCFGRVQRSAIALSCSKQCFRRTYASKCLNVCTAPHLIFTSCTC